MSLGSFDIDILGRCCELAYLSSADDTAYSVGCVLVRGVEVLSEGYSHFGGSRLHAEEVAIERAESNNIDLCGVSLYSSLQPCGIRLSGVRSCQELILSVGIVRVIYAIREPDYFLCHGGDDFLLEGGVEVIYANRFLDAVSGANKFVNTWHEQK